MGNIGTVFRFGGQYLRRYWTRLAAGIIFGILFGLTSASFMLATKEVVNRMTPAVAVAAVAPEITSTNFSSPDAAPVGFTARFKTGAAAFKARAETAAEQRVDPWLPKSGRDIDWRQFLGGLLFLPLLAAMRGFCGYLSSYCISWVSERVVNDLRGDVLEKLSGLSLDYFNRSTIGDMLTRVSGDTGSCKNA